MPKKIIIAPDKFKGSLTSLEFCKIVAEELSHELPSAEIIQLPLADGGDGTTDVLAYYLSAEKIEVKTYNPLFREINANYLYSSEKETAYIEMAAASGLHLLNKQAYNPLITSTFGTGELIKDAIERGAKNVLLGIGGSATNDAGLGMARALGYQFLDEKGNQLDGCGKDLLQLNEIRVEKVHNGLKNIDFTVACDVTAPLFGKAGAAYVYAPQKGATSKMVYELDTGLRHFNEIVKRTFRRDISQQKGVGAAGGLGAGAVIFLNATLTSGIEIIKHYAQFSSHLQNADWVISGEGRLDAQTFQGKVIKGVLDEITTQKVALFCGQNELSNTIQTTYSIDYLDEISAYTKSPDDAMNNAKDYLREITRKFVKNGLLLSPHDKLK